MVVKYDIRNWGGGDLTPFFDMRMTNIKETQLRQFIEKWIQDDKLYCSNCGDHWRKPPEGCEPIICCDRMQICTNLVGLYAVVKENKILRETRANPFASTKDKSIRMGLSFPPKLLFDLELFCENELKEPFLRDVNEMNDFMREFPQLCIPERV